MRGTYAIVPGRLKPDGVAPAGPRNPAGAVPLYGPIMRSRRGEGARAWSATASVLLVCLGASPAAAKSISITMTPVVELRDGSLVVNLTVGNVGDEAAQSVTPTLRFGDREARGKGTERLAPQGTLSEALSLPVGELGPGRWPYQVTVDYTDANQYPFQALNVHTVAVGNPPPARVMVPSVTGTPVSASGSGTLAVKVKNLTGANRTAAVGVLVPAGIEVTKVPAEVALAAWEEKTISASITNRTSLAGSRLPVFVTVQYDDGSTHQAVVTQGLVEIVAAQSFFARQRLLLGVGALLLIVGWGGFLVARLAGRR